MSDIEKAGAAPPGSIAWIDLTVADAERIRDFYAQVAGWSHAPVEMGGYVDYVMHDTPGEPAAGICHASGVNADLPPVWLIYITVRDLTASLASCTAMGGELLTGVKDMGGIGRYCVIRDPAGAVAALLEPKR
jgi:predicted enzyme related to lactoylglutathione lyase